MNKMNNEYTPGCFQTKEYRLGNGICKSCRKYSDCGTAIQLQGHLIIKDKEEKNIIHNIKKQKGGQDGNNNFKKRGCKKTGISLLRRR